MSRVPVICVVSLLCAGCLPHVMHGPRIEDDGVSGSVSLTLGTNRRVFGGNELQILPSLYTGVRQSFVRPDADGPAASLGLQVPILLAPLLFEDNGFRSLAATSYVDVYVQPLRRVEPATRLETGLGALVSTDLLAPYLQVGRMDAHGSGWYMTQLVSLPGRGLGSGVLYMPSVALRMVDRERYSAGNFSLGLGVLRDRGRTDLLFVFGMTMEVGLGR